MTEGRRAGDAFVLRIWWEEDARPLWRGWVQHATSSETRYFECLADLLGFVETYTGPLAQAPVAKARKPRKETY